MDTENWTINKTDFNLGCKTIQLALIYQTMSWDKLF